MRLKEAMCWSNSVLSASSLGGFDGTLAVRVKNFADASSIVVCPMCKPVQRIQNLVLQSAHHMLSSKLPWPGLRQNPLLSSAPGAIGADVVRVKPIAFPVVVAMF